ncbi:SET and MYND domain-containing protein 4, partial [Lobosporangium transversale]
MTTTSVSHENDIIQDYVHAQLTAACKEGSLTLETIIEKPVLDCYNHEKLLDLMALPTLDIASIKEAFMPPCTMPNRAAIIDRIIAAGFDPLPDIQSISNVVAMTTTSTTTTATVRTTPVTLSGIPPIDGRTRLDPRFKVGFSELHGHAVEIDRKSNDSNRLEAHGRRRVESGTYIFEHDEMPYASVIEKVWKDRLCEECLRRLPKDSEVVACPSCPKVRSNASSAEITFNRSSLSSSTSQGRFTDQKIPQSDGVARFCSQSCLQSAWRAWHGYECGYSAQLMGHSQLTRLALRILWQNVRHGIFITASLLDLLTPAPTTSDPAFSLINTVADLSLDTDGSSLDMSNNSLCYSPRSINTNGSDILPSQLCHNFGRLNRVTKLAFLMTGYYLQWLIDLPEDLAVELAYLQALVKFNSFAIKAHFLTSMDRSKNITERNEYTIGSALYPLASMFNHSCTPNAMVVFGKDGKLLQDKSVGGGLKDDFKEPDPRLINVITSKALRVDSDLPVFIKISYGPQAGRMSTKERKEYLRQSYLFECDCSACDD